MSFANWDDDLHQNYEQIKRINSAKSISSSKITLNNEKETAIFVGSGSEPYVTTLNDCDCVDFIRRGLPCKHIYRLALELGYLNNLPKYNKRLTREIDFTPDLKRYYELYLEGAIAAEDYVKLVEIINKIKK